jgi:hypothetical protein
VVGIREFIRVAVRSEWFANGITRLGPLCLDPVRNSKEHKTNRIETHNVACVKLESAKTTTEDRKAAAEAGAAAAATSKT